MRCLEQFWRSDQRSTQQGSCSEVRGGFQNHQSRQVGQPVGVHPQPSPHRQGRHLHTENGPHRKYVGGPDGKNHRDLDPVQRLFRSLRETAAGLQAQTLRLQGCVVVPDLPSQIAGDYLADFRATNYRFLALQPHRNLGHSHPAVAGEMARHHSSDLYSLTSALWEGRGTTLWKTLCIRLWKTCGFLITECRI